MKILGIDPSYSNFAIVIYDTELDQTLYSKNIKFNALSSLNKAETEMFTEYTPYRLMSDSGKLYYKEIWNNIRLNYFINEVRSLYPIYNYDVVVTESQFVQALSDVFACVRIASVIDNNALPFYSYKPKSWNKILFGNGGMPSIEAKSVTKEKLQNIGINYGNCQDLYDAHAIILSYIKKELNIYDSNYWLQFLVNKTRKA